MSKYFALLRQPTNIRAVMIPDHAEKSAKKREAAAKLKARLARNAEDVPVGTPQERE